MSSPSPISPGTSQHRTNRRRFLAAAIGLVPAALAAGAAFPGRATAQDFGPGPIYDAGPVVGTAVTTAPVNLRSGPGTANTVLRVVPAGAAVQITDTVANGYRYVVHEALGGWVFDEYLSRGGPGEPPYDPNYATTTANVNLRAEPSLSGAILTVIPAGTRVRLNPEFANGFRGVEHLGTNGWVRVDYLN
jgi:D-alanyl-D-alanine carboxypeptidase